MRETGATIRLLHIPATPDLTDTVGATLDFDDEQIELRTAVTAEEALELVATTEVDCIIADYELPDLDGIELLEAIRKAHPALPFVLYTDSGSEEIASAAISAGVSAYLRPETGGQTRAITDQICDLVTQYRADAERERKLERTADLLAKTERIADVGGWEIDTDTNEVFWTDHLFELMGIDGNEEPPLEGALDIYHEEDRPIIARAVESALSEGDPFDVEVRFRRPDDEIRWLRVQGVPDVVDGHVETLRGTVQDVTERYTRERILREMHDIISDRDHSFDEQVRRLLELGRTELDTRYGTLSEIRDGDYIFEIVAADDSIQEGDVVPVSATNCEIAASTEQTLVLGDVERDAPDQTHRTGFAEWGISCYLGAPVFVDDEVYGTFCFYDTEARADQFTEWEETLVDLMSRWVSYELQRRQVTEKLHEQNEQLERFASIVSHDLRNPLSIIEGYVDMAVETGEIDHLSRVQSAVKRMDTLIDDVLLLSRTENAISDCTAVDLGSLANRCWETVPTEAATLTVTADPTVEADVTRLKQLLENLFRNSVEHGSTDSRPQADDSVEHGSTENRTQSGDSVEHGSTDSRPQADDSVDLGGKGVHIRIGELDTGFYFEDDGPGIPEDERETVFENGYSTAENGTGLGLSIVKEIVDAHGWEVQITEAEGGGARFEITGVDRVSD
jgi:signal transduction histidine kinase/DNA-binding response OmpR family regulator